MDINVFLQINRDTVQYIFVLRTIKSVKIYFPVFNHFYCIFLYETCGNLIIMISKENYKTPDI